jgi:hypothetical protein
LDVGSAHAGALSLALCLTNNEIQIRYLGTLDGLYNWSQADKKWVKIQQIPGNVWDVLITGENCNEIYAAALENGLWKKKADQVTQIPTNTIPPVGSVVSRDDYLFAGTDGGIKVYDIEQGQWTAIDTGVENLITEQSSSIGGERIYAAVWTVGVAYNDTCAANNCPWETIQAPPNHIYVRDVLGNPQGPNEWILIATSAGVTYWDGNTWHEPAQPPQPAGDVFALAMSPDGTTAYAAVNGGGVWATQDDGHTWFKLGELPYTIFDLTIGKDGLYATTTNNGVWRWPLP